MPEQPARHFWSDALAVAFGSLMTLCVSGYQFGRGNHTVYLLEGLHLARPELLDKDWFVTSTLQYHAMFSWVTAMLMRLHWLEGGFLLGYIAIILLWHIAWLKFTQRLGGSRFAYVVSVLLYYLSAAGIGLGVYQFLQDGCFLPSNVANVALLWGFYLWVTRRPLAAGICFGAAGLFHLNYAMVGVGAWVALLAWDWRDRRRTPLSPSMRTGKRIPIILGSLIALGPSLFNVTLALRMKLSETGSIPLDRFVEVYVHFRHTHHFDPLHWPNALWISFLWPFPLAVWAWLRTYRQTIADEAHRDLLRQTARVFALMLALQVVTFLFAGVWYVSEALVQLMLWRFSVYVKLLTCIGAAWALVDARLIGRRPSRVLLFAVPVLLVGIITVLLHGTGMLQGQSIDVARTALTEHLPAIALFVGLCAIIAFASLPPSAKPTSGAVCAMGVAFCFAVAIVGWNRGLLGWGMTPETVDSDYLNLCHWARDNTPVDAVFLVPPQDTVFRLEAQRAIVVNFKHVPQLSGELMEWVGRLEEVLGTSDLEHFPHGYVETMRALDQRYNAQPPEELLRIAGKYSARYIVTSRDWGPRYQTMLIRRESGHYFVYDRGLTRQ
jgi:hypothetical protein